MVAFQDVSIHFSGTDVVAATGSEPLLLVCECATYMVLIRAKAFIGILVGGSGDGTLGASLSLLGAPLRGTLSYIIGFRSENPVQFWTSDNDSFSVVPFLGRHFLRPVATCGSDVVVWLVVPMRRGGGGVLGLCWR